MLYGYDIVNLHTDKELEAMKQVYSIVVYLNILGFSNLVLSDLKQATIISFALAKINEQFNSMLQRNFEYDDVEDTTVFKMQSTTFSNQVILSCPLIVKSEVLIIREVIEMISDIQLYLLKEGILIKGGITVGDICHHDKYVFGRAVVEVCELENKNIYPRVIMSKEILTLDAFKYLLDDKSFYHQYLQQDIDQITYIDYLGGTFLALAEILCPDYEDDFKSDYLDKINKVIEQGKRSNDHLIKEMYLWLADKYRIKLNIIKNN